LYVSDENNKKAEEFLNRFDKFEDNVIEKSFGSVAQELEDALENPPPAVILAK